MTTTQTQPLTPSSITSSTFAPIVPLPWYESLDFLALGGTLYTTCPDGIERRIGYLRHGYGSDIWVYGWQGEVWMDCADGTLRIAFTEPKIRGFE